MQLDRHFPEVQLQSGTVIYRVLIGVLGHIPTSVFISTETLESIFVFLVDRCSCQTKEEGVRQSSPHTLSEISFLCSVRLVNHHDDVVA